MRSSPSLSGNIHTGKAQIYVRIRKGGLTPPLSLTFNFIYLDFNSSIFRRNHVYLESRKLDSIAGEFGMKKCTILFPRDGDMLNERDGELLEDGSLSVPVKVISDQEVYINGLKAAFKDGLYQASVSLKSYENTVTVTCGKETETLKVYRLKNYVGKYRLSLDDNIWFLEDLAKNSRIYRSLFENPYLNLMKRIHDRYGTKIHINIYYQTEGSFNLTMMRTSTKASGWKMRTGCA